jgi:hypothetical protein
MVMVGQFKRLQTPSRVSRRDRRVLAGLIAVAVAAIVAGSVLALTAGSTSHAGCVSVTFAGSTGAEQINACGSQAARICASAYAGSITGVPGAELRADCPRAGHPPPQPSPRAP